eukprot:1199720-Pyramimonas_sp.AAC.1
MCSFCCFLKLFSAGEFQRNRVTLGEDGVQVGVHVGNVNWLVCEDRAPVCKYGVVHVRWRLGDDGGTALRDSDASEHQPLGERFPELPQSASSTSSFPPPVSLLAL